MCIRNGKYLSDLELEEIQRKIDQPLREVTDESEVRGNNSLVNHDDIAYAADARPGTSADEQSNTEMDNLSHEQVELLEKLKEKLKKPEFLEAVNLMAADRAKVKEKTSKVNSVIDSLANQSIGDINTLLLAGANVVADMMGKKKGAKKGQHEPWWKRRKLMKIGDLRNDISKLDQWKRGKLGKEGVKNRLEQTYHLRKRGLETVIEELKQKVKGNGCKNKKV